jgi:hypothetical protein
MPQTLASRFQTPLALSLLNAAADPRTHLTWTPPSRHMIAQFRAAVYYWRYVRYVRTNLAIHPKS